MFECAINADAATLMKLKDTRDKEIGLQQSPDGHGHALAYHCSRSLPRTSQVSSDTENGEHAIWILLR